MKDLDTKNLSEMYDQLAGVPLAIPQMLTESTDPKEQLILEGVIDRIGGSGNPNAVYAGRLLHGFVVHEIPSNINNPLTEKALNTKAATILENLSKSCKDPMITRTLKQYSDMSPVSKTKMLHKLLSL